MNLKSPDSPITLLAHKNLSPQLQRTLRDTHEIRRNDGLALKGGRSLFFRVA